jgi:hypothetical protein
LLRLVCALILAVSSVAASSAGHATPAGSDQTYGVELNQPPLLGPTITVSGIQAGAPIKVIGYGDTRFTAPRDIKNTNPRMRKFLVDRIAEEAPDAIFETGDLPMRGSNPEDWQVFREETAPWRAKSLRVYPTLGNHEIVDDIDTGIHNYLAEFSDLQNCRYYSVLLGNVYLISIDEFTSMAEGSPQRTWLVSQLEHLPPRVNFVFFLDHMPLVNDLQTEVAAGLPQMQETYLRRLLETEKSKTRAAFVVLSGHIHNYERFQRAGIEYIVTGGGGAKPYPIFVRGNEDLYRDTRFPVFHYVVFQVHGAHIDATMYRVDKPSAANPKMEVGERFTLDAGR